MKIFNQSGVLHLLPLLIIVAFLGIISFVLITATAPFKGTFEGLFPKPASRAAEVIPPNCSDSLQAKINAAAAGSTVTLNQNCVYRETITINKSLILDGGKVAQIRGSDIWTDWNPMGTTWTSTQTVPLTNNNNRTSPSYDGRCAKDDCVYPMQVFIDGIKQKLVLNTTPTQGQFSVDANYVTGPLNPPHIILGTNPSGHIVEVTTRYWWINGNLQPTDNVTVQNFTMKHAGTDGGKGSIDIHTCNNCQPTSGQIIIQDNDLSYSHGENLAVYANTQVLRNNSYFADNFGIGSGDNIVTNRTNTLVKNNKIHDNNLDDLYNPGWGAGGLKNGTTHSSTVDGNEIYGNHGVGLWCDIACTNITYSNNLVHDNTMTGIMFEISNGVKIFGNKVWRNGFGDNANWVFPAGILVASSANAEVYNNTLAWNARGITVNWQKRSDEPATAGTGNFVHDNNIIQTAQNINYYWANTSLAWAQETGGPIAPPASNNRGANNKYWYDQPENFFSQINSPQFAWPNGGSDTGYFTIASFNATPGGEGGRYLTNTEKDSILAQNLMPACITCAIPTAAPSAIPSATPSAIPGDLDGDRDVDIFDYNILVGSFGKSGIQGDIDNDGDVDIFDYNILVGNFGRSL